MSTIDKTALEHLEQRTLQAHAIEGTAIPARLVPKDVVIKSLEHLMPHRASYRGGFVTHLIHDFATYASEWPAGRCFVDQEHMSARIYFDLGTVETPGHGEHHGNIQLQRTAPFVAFRNMAGDTHTQKALAEWLEDWAAYLVAFDSTGEVLNIGAAINAVRRITIAAKKESTTSQNGVEVGFNFPGNPFCFCIV